MVKKLLILAGGDGTRLKTVTGALSKPLVKVGKERVVTIVIKKLSRDLGVDHVYLLIQKKHELQYLEYLNSNEISTYKVSLVVESQKLGTGGAIKNFLENNDVDEFYVSNGDTIIKSDIRDFSRVAANSVLCTEVKKNKRFSNIEINKNYQIVGVNNHQHVIDSIVSVGVYKFKSSFFYNIKDRTFDIESVFLRDSSSYQKLNCHLMDIDFEDIGIPEAFYKEIRKEGSG